MGCKVRAAAASCLDAELGEKHPRSHQGLPPAQGTAARVEEAAFAPAPPQDTQVSAHRKYILAEIKQLIAKAPPRTHRPRTPPDTAAPPPPSRPCWSHRQGELLGCPIPGTTTQQPGPGWPPACCSGTAPGCTSRTAAASFGARAGLSHLLPRASRPSGSAGPLGRPRSLLQPQAGNARAGSSPCRGHANVTPRPKPNSPTLSHLHLRHQCCGCR